jgi:hypothetical protein
MSSSTQAGGGEEEFTPDAGSSTDQYVTGATETGTFTVDEAPTGNTPAHGSSNAGVNALGANRTESVADAANERASEG